MCTRTIDFHHCDLNRIFGVNSVVLLLRETVRFRIVPDNVLGIHTSELIAESQGSILQGRRTIRSAADESRGARSGDTTTHGFDFRRGAFFLGLVMIFIAKVFERPRGMEDKTSMTIQERLAQLDWNAIESSLWQRGYAKTYSLLSAEECDALIALYSKDQLFRSRIDMKRFRFGEGEYKYFTYPSPPRRGFARKNLSSSCGDRERLGKGIGSVGSFSAEP